MAQQINRDEFTGRVVLTVEMDVMDLDVNVAQANLETLLAERLDQWPNEVVDYRMSTELFAQ